MGKQWDDDAFEGSTGLYRQFEITIASSVAKTPEKYDGPVWVLEGELKLPNGDLKDGDLRLSFGQVYEPGDDGGTYIVHQTGDNTKKVSSQTSMMKFISSMKNAENGDQLKAILQERSRVIGDVDLMNRDLSIWEGLRLSVDHYKELRTNPQTGVEKEAEQPYIVAFLGTADAPVAASVGGAAVPAAASNGAGSTDAIGAVVEGIKSYPSYVGYLTAFTEAGGDASDARAQRPFYDAAIA